jgi:hypothetical protein
MFLQEVFRLYVSQIMVNICGSAVSVQAHKAECLIDSEQHANKVVVAARKGEVKAIYIPHKQP